MFSHRFCSVSECKEAFVSEKFSPPHDLKHLQLCAIESMIQLTASNLLHKLHFKSRATRLHPALLVTLNLGFLASPLLPKWSGDLN